MPGPKRPVKPGRVACGECAKEIPASAATTAEGKDYLMYFCGLDCQAKWQRGKRQAGPKSGLTAS